MQAASCYTPEQKAGLLTAQNVLFARMHEILEAREAIMNTLQVGLVATASTGLPFVTVSVIMLQGDIIGCSLSLWQRCCNQAVRKVPILLQANFPCAETEHKNAPLYVQVSCSSALRYSHVQQEGLHCPSAHLPHLRVG